MANPWELYANAAPAPMQVSPIDAAISAEAKSPEEIAFLKSIFMQESSGGKNTKTSNRGAVGIGQIQPGTFKEVADKGWDISNPIQNAQASARYALKHFRENGGNTIVAAAGYYGGPGGAAKAKNGQAVSDPKNTKAPDTLKYGADVTARLPPWQQYAQDVKKFTTPVHEGMQHIPTPDEVKQDLYYQEVQKRGPEAMKRYLRTKQMSPVSKILTSAGNEAIKFGLGTKEAGSGTAGMIANLFGADKLDQFFADKMLEATRQNAEMDTQNKEYEENAGFWGGVGKALPYIVNSEGIGKPLVKGAGKVLTTVTEIPASAGRATRGVVVPAIEDLASKNIPFLTKGAQNVKRVITDPWARNVANKTKQVNFVNPYRVGVGADMLGSTALGGIEGILHPDYSFSEGATSSAIGAGLGNAIKPYLVKAPVFRSDTEKELLRWGEDQGLKYLPGMQTGSKRLQKFEHAMRSDSTFADPIHRFDAGNDIVMNRTAFNAMGIPKGEIDTMTPSLLDAHLKKLGNEYDTLENGTVANFRPIDKTELKSYVTNLAKDQTVAGRVLAKDATDYLKQIDQYTPQRDPLTGRIKAMDMQGSQYKDLRRRIQSDINKAYANGDSNRAEVLKPILTKVDDAVERGIRQGKGIEGVNKWKDLNERFAMTNLIIEHGMNPVGKFDPSRLAPHLLNSDTKRLLTERGNRIVPLQKMVKLDWMAKHQMGSDLSGLGTKNIYNPTNPGIVPKLLMTPAAGFLPAIPEAALKLYTKGYPVTTGLLGMSGEGFGRPSLYTRAYEVSQQPHVAAANFVIDKSSALKNKLEEYYDKMMFNEDKNKTKKK